MKKFFAEIAFWWNYVVLKKERTEYVEKYGKDYNKKNNLYYYRDNFKIDYIGTKEISRIRIGRTFVKKEEYVAHMYNA